MHDGYLCAIIVKEKGEAFLLRNRPQENTAAMVNCFTCRKLHALEETGFYQLIVVAKK